MKKMKKFNQFRLIISLFLLLAVTVSDIKINPMLPLNNIEALAEKKNVYTYTPEKYPYTQYLDDDVYVYKINLKTGKLTKVKKLLIGTKVKVIGLASSKKKTFCKIKTTDGKLYFIDTTSNPYALVYDNPGKGPRYIFEKQEPQTAYFYNTAYVYSLNLRNGMTEEEKKIKVRTKVTVLGTAISQDSRFTNTYYKIKTAAGNIYYVKIEMLGIDKPAPFNTDYKNHARYSKITKKYQKNVDKIMSNYVITFDDLLYVSSLIGADTLIEWTNDGLSWESIVSSAERVTGDHILE